MLLASLLLIVQLDTTVLLDQLSLIRVQLDSSVLQKQLTLELRHALPEHTVPPKNLQLSQVAQLALQVPTA